MNFLLKEESQALYDKFIAANRQFWEPFSPAQSELKDEYILVDLLIPHYPYVMGTLQLAKYYQKRTNAKIIAVTRTKEFVEKYESFLSSYGITETITIHDQFKENSDYEDKYITVLRSKGKPHKLRQALLEWTHEGINIGPLVYDSYMRQKGEPTVKVLNHNLINYFYEGLKYFREYDKIFKERKVIAAFMAHRVYLEYGLLAQLAIKYGAEVFCRQPATSPCSVRKFTRIEEFNEFETSFMREHFEWVKNNQKEKALEFSRSYYEGRLNFKPKKGTDAYCSIAYSNDKKVYSKADLKESLGVDLDKPIVYIMPHCFSDAPHRDMTMIHDDYLEWLIDTLEIIKGVDSVNWILKPHPENKFYLKEDWTKILTEPVIEEHNHIFIAPDDLHSKTLFETAHAVVTVNGSAAIEFPSNGIPCIASASNAYVLDGYGYLSIARSREEYVKLLSEIHSRPDLSQEQIETALICSYCLFYLDKVDGAFLPYMSHLAMEETGFDEAGFFQQANEALEKYSLDDDLLYKNFNLQLEHDLPNIMRFEEMPGLLNA